MGRPPRPAEAPARPVVGGANRNRYTGPDARSIPEVLADILRGALDPLRDRHAASDVEAAAAILADVVATGSEEILLVEPGAVPVAAGSRHWPIFRDVLHASDARRNFVPDAHLAAVAIEHGATVATRDRGFARFAAATWFDPVQPAGA